jgi:hypothetical protein
MDLRVKISNYKILKNLDITIKSPLTLIRGKSDNGKSSFFQAVKSFLSNVSIDDHIQHGQKGFEIQVNDVVYGRDTQSTYYKIGEAEAKRKLNKSSLQDIYPDFPLKYFKIDADTFFPNFVFQGEIPIFGQLDIYAFFSSLYKSLDKINGLFLECKKDKTGLTEDVNKVGVEVNFVRGELLRDQDSIKIYDPVKLKSIVDDDIAYQELRNNIDSKRRDIIALDSDIALFDIYNKYLDLDLTALEETYTKGQMLLQKKAQWQDIVGLRASYALQEIKITDIITGLKGLKPGYLLLQKKQQFEDCKAQFESTQVKKQQLQQVVNLLKGLKKVASFNKLKDDYDFLVDASGKIKVLIDGIKKDLAKINFCPVCKQEIKGNISERSLTVDKTIIDKIEKQMGSLEKYETQQKEIDAKLSVLGEKLKEFDPAEMAAIDETKIAENLKKVEELVQGI